MTGDAASDSMEGRGGEAMVQKVICLIGIFLLLGGWLGESAAQDTYKNPYENQPVQLPSGYQDAWVNGRGEYILSNGSGFNPNVGDTTEWRRMERERR